MSETMTPKPHTVIGLTTYGVAHSDGFNIPRQYVQAVFRAGGIPILFPPLPLESVDFWLDRIHGLILIGGGDMDPACYDAPGHETVYNIDADRDECEFALALAALRREMPILAICRGLQIINVALGGTLHTHLPEVFGEKILHRLPPRETSRHMVTVDPKAHIASVMGNTQVEIVSWHHQSIDRMGKGLYPVAWSADGVIEAAQMENYPNLLAVQWHPELSAAEDPLQQRLFDRLVELAENGPKING